MPLKAIPGSIYSGAWRWGDGDKSRWVGGLGGLPFPPVPPDLPGIPSLPVRVGGLGGCGSSVVSICEEYVYVSVYVQLSSPGTSSKTLPLSCTVTVTQKTMLR